MNFLGKNKYYYGIPHCHTAYSTGRGTPLDAFEYGKENDLDFMIITDHNSFLEKTISIQGKEISRWISTKNIVEKFRKKNESLKCDYIYLATEEEKIYKMFDNAFPEKVITNQRHYYDEFYELRDKYGDKARISWVHSDRNNDNYYKSLEYMSSLFLLSKCNALIAGSCGGSQAALYLNGNSYEYWYLFDLGLY